MTLVDGTFQPSLHIEPPVCEKCGGAVITRDGMNTIWAERKKLELDYDDLGEPVFKIVSRWVQEIATYRYHYCLTCNWVTTRPTSPNIIGSAFYAE